MPTPAWRKKEKSFISWLVHLHHLHQLLSSSCCFDFFCQCLAPISTFLLDGSANFFLLILGNTKPRKFYRGWFLLTTLYPKYLKENLGLRGDQTQVTFNVSSASYRFIHYAMASRTANWALNKCRPILVQGLRQDIEINFHIDYIYGSVAQWISNWLWIWRTPVRYSIRGIFFHLNFFF